MNAQAALFVFFSVAGFGPSLYAASMLCQQNARDVAVKINAVENQMKMEVTVPLGFDYLPMLEAPVSPISRHLLQYQTEQLALLKDHFTVSWKLKDCQVIIKKTKTETRLECAGQSVSSVPEIQFHSLTVNRITESTIDKLYVTRRFRMMVSREGKYGTDFFSLAVPISETACADYE